ncbi:MAG: SpoIID/LytB domain-containing protein [Elusimicrobia bacterium]|nr:SpoIID/LytB domain-containing protein [Elusimicrobiota bacterium]
MSFIVFILFELNLFSEISNLNNLAYTNYLNGNLKKSIEYYKALYETEKNYNALLNIAMIYKDMDDYKNSLYYLERALDIKRTDDVLTEAGWLYFHTSNIDKARVYFEDAFKLNSNNYNAVLGLATVYSQLGDVIKTVDYLNVYKKLRGDYSGVDYIFAWNYFNFKMYHRAKEYLVATLRKDPSFVEARVPLAQIYLKEGDYNQAWNQYYRILDDVPDHPVAMRMIKIIEGKLTKQPEEIRPPFKINNPTVIDETYDINNLKKSIKLRIAIGANDSGKQRANTELKFRSFGGIGVYGKSGKKYSEIGKNEILRLKYDHGQIYIYSGNNVIKNIFKRGFILKPLDPKNGSIIIESDYKSLNPYFKYSDREYRGDIEIVPLNNGFGLINIVDLEIYLLGVVPAEMEPKWPIEALKAQAVIARTEAVRRYKEGPHKKQGYDLCDTEHCQVYRGVSFEKNSSNKAVFETEGRVLTYNNRLAYSFYHSNCGGYIQSSSEVTGWGRVPYLISHPDYYEKKDGLEPWEFEFWIKGNPEAYCNYPGVVHDNEFRWMRIIKRSEINFKLNKRYNIGELKSIAVMRRSKSGNVNSVKITGSKRSVTVDREHIIRNIFGLNSLKSTLFNVEINRFPDGRIRNVWFYGGGWGHSIGMCQGGAAGMAGKYGKTYKEILNFYFPGTKVKRLKFIKKSK